VTENIGELCISEMPKPDWNIVDSFMDTVPPVELKAEHMDENVVMDTVPPVELKEEHVDENVVAEQNMSDIKPPQSTLC
jgi:hypothetical protein